MAGAAADAILQAHIAHVMSGQGHLANAHGLALALGGVQISPLRHALPGGIAESVIRHTQPGSQGGCQEPWPAVSFSACGGPQEPCW